MPHNHYLHRRRQTWYVRLAVPPKLIKQVGKSHIVRSLKTREIEVARQRRWTVMAEIRNGLAELQGAAADPIQQGLKDREWWLSASDDPADADPDNRHTPREQVAHVLDDVAEEIEAKQGPEAAKAYYRIATSPSPILSEVTRLWLREIKGTVAGQTQSQHRFAVELFVDSLSRPSGGTSILFVAQVDRRVAGRFVSEVLRRSPRSQKTNNRIISSLSACWKWMIKRGLANDNPWRDQGEYTRKAKGQRTKRPYSEKELIALLEADPVKLMKPRYGGAIRDLLRLGLLTGARLNELCELRVDDVDMEEKTIAIRIGKTDSAARLIPMHRSILPIFQRRLQEAQDGQLFNELEPQGPDQKRSWYVSKRFTEYRRKVLGDDDTLDFHSLRRSFATYLERAQAKSLSVNPSVIAELMGHRKQSLALSLYSGGLRLKDLRTAISSLGKVVEPRILAAI